MLLGLRPTTLFAVVLILAAFLYGFRLGNGALGASEAYSAWAASKPSVGAIVAVPVLEDPGKQVLYYVLLHYFTALFGASETSLRMPSAIFAVAAVALLFALGVTLFGERVGALGALIWALNPIAIIFARRARMYPMLAVLALAHFMALWAVRKRGSPMRVVSCGLLGAAMLYTHLAGLVLIGAEEAMLVRDWYRGRGARWPWAALMLSLVLFAPYIPTFMEQSQTLVYGQWLDWVGTPHHYSAATKAAVTLAGAAIAFGIVFGPAIERDENEPLRWCVAWALLPLLAFIGGGIVVRPMLHVRYLTPCIAVMALIAGRALDLLASRARNLAIQAIGATMLAVAAFLLLRPADEPWRQVAARIAATGNSKEPVFFEAGFVSVGRPATISNGGFPAGYYRVPFDYYFRGANPRYAVPGFDPASARETIAQKVMQAGGGWLVSWKQDTQLRAELPDSEIFRNVEKLRAPQVVLYRIEPAPSALPTSRRNASE